MLQARETVPVRTIATPSPQRERAGAWVLIAGAVLVAALTLAGVPPYGNLLALGAVAVVAWLVDGTGRRYVGPGLIALAAGLGITIGKELGVDPYEHTLVYGGFGLALLLISYVNPMAARASGAFLVYTALTVAVTAWVVSIPLGWELAAILAVWGAYGLIRLRRRSNDDATPGSSPGAGLHGRSHEMAASGRR